MKFKKIDKKRFDLLDHFVSQETRRSILEFKSASVSDRAIRNIYLTFILWVLAQVP